MDRVAIDAQPRPEAHDRDQDEAGTNASFHSFAGATVELTPCTGFARFVAAVLLLSIVVVFGIAMQLTPSPTGLGTHQSLGRLLGEADWPPCTSVVVFGLPCPTCGMTTSFAHFVRGQWFASFHVQPAGFILAMGCAVGAAYCGYVFVSGKRVRVRSRWYSAGRVAMLLIGIVVVGWAYKLIVMMTSGRL